MTLLEEAKKSYKSTGKQHRYTEEEIEVVIAFLKLEIPLKAMMKVLKFRTTNQCYVTSIHVIRQLINSNQIEFKL